MPIDYPLSRQTLDNEFVAVELAVLAGNNPIPPVANLTASFDTVFASGTQAYREVLLGCVLAKLQDGTIDIHKPYLRHGANSYNGRTLDERVINPFLHDKRIPSSRGPYLSTFRRSVAFEAATREGLRDRNGFDALLGVIDYVDGAAAEDLTTILRYALYRFILLRDAADVPLSRLHRISLEQYDTLIAGLLDTPSGGRFPVILIEAAFTAMNDFFGLGWTIDVQGINVADGPAGAGGDIMIRAGGVALLSAEVTERPLDRNRVVATFQAKIAPNAIEDYLFFVKHPVPEDVLRQARQYFAQGHEINFLQMREWLRTILSTIGRRGRDAFNRVILERLEAADMPTALKVAWNEHISRIVEA